MISQNTRQKYSLQQIINTTKSDTSRIMALVGLTQYYNKANSDSTKLFADSVWNESKRKNYVKGLQASSNHLGAYYNKKGEYNKALEQFKISLEYARQLKNEKEIARQLFSIANTYTYRTDQPNALKYHLEALSIREKILDSLGIASSYNSLSYVYRAKNDMK